MAQPAEAVARPVVPCAGVPITACTLDRAVDLVIEMATVEHQANGADIHLCNAYTLALADQDSGLKNLLRRSSVNFPDGMSVVWANRWRHRGLGLPHERVSGPDLFERVFDVGQSVGLRHYLLGSTPEVLADLRAELIRRYPAAEIMGAESPPFRELTDQEWDDQQRRLRDSRAQVVWVGLGTPKQDWAAQRLAAEVPAVVVAVGAAFDFVAGHANRAPEWMQRGGLEWVFRLSSEPRRLWRRYLLGNLQFARAAARSR